MLPRSLFVWLAIGSLSACSLLLDRRADQCASDGDCARFVGTFCDTTLRLCTFGDGNPDPRNHPDAGGVDSAQSDAAPETGLGCHDSTGCVPCSPTADIGYANRCTNSSCRPFDNRARLKRLLPDGGLLRLPEAGASPLSE